MVHDGTSRTRRKTELGPYSILYRPSLTGWRKAETPPVRDTWSNGKESIPHLQFLRQGHLSKHQSLCHSSNLNHPFNHRIPFLAPIPRLHSLNQNTSLVRYKQLLTAIRSLSAPSLLSRPELPLKAPYTHTLARLRCRLWSCVSF